MVRSSRVAMMRRDRMSRPSWSVPMRLRAEGGLRALATLDAIGS